MESEAPDLEYTQFAAPQITINQEEFLSNIAIQEEDANIITEIFFKCNAKKLSDIENLTDYEKFFMDIFYTLNKKPLIGKQFLKYFIVIFQIFILKIFRKIIVHLGTIRFI